MKKKKVIGIFDSGVGGLSVVKQVIKYLPNYDLVYFGDTARVPYGSKGNETIKRYAIEDADFLCNKNAGLILIGCNTASAVAYIDVKKHFPLPIIDIISPGAKEALNVSKNKRIGVIATSATINSHAHENYLKKINSQVKVFNKACPLLVSLAESNSLSKKIVYEILKEYISPLVKERIDTLILGCTHYPYFEKDIKKLFPSLNLIDPGKQASLDLKKLLINDKLIDNQLSKDGVRKFYVSDEPQDFKMICEKFLGKGGLDIEKVRI